MVLPSTTLTDCWDGPQYITQVPSFLLTFPTSFTSFIAKAYAMCAPVTLFPVPAGGYMSIEAFVRIEKIAHQGVLES